MSVSGEATKLSGAHSVLVLLAFGAIVFFAVSISRSCSDNMAANQQKIDDCVKRGVKYFIDGGAYPRLSDGRVPFEVATERCRRTSNAF